MLNLGYPIGGIGANPFASLTAGAPLTAGINGVVWDRFAWADPISGQISNVYTEGFILGYVLPQPERYGRNGWNLAYWNDEVANPGLVLRLGQMVTLAAKGDFWTRFPAGAQVGAQVFADNLDGTAWVESVVYDSNGNPVLDSHGHIVMSNQAPGGAQATGWTVMTCAQPGGRALISSWVQPF